MILISGGTGVLGRAIARQLLEEGRSVRVMTRNPARAEALHARGAQVVVADLRDPESVRRAVSGATYVITTANAFVGRGAESVAAVDVRGTQNLIDAARDAGAKRFTFTSARLPPAYRSIDYFAAKFENEEYLHRSGLTWTILRPTAFMETWASMIGEPLVTKGSTQIFGEGTNPVNFVAVDDVAKVAAMTLDRPDAEKAIVEIGGPENLTLLEVADIFERVTGKKGRRKHLPVPLMRMMAPLVRPFNPVFARMIRAGILAATVPQPFDPAPMLARFPITLTRLEDWVRARY